MTVFGHDADLLMQLFLPINHAADERM